MPTTPLDLWTLTRGRPQIDPHDLARAIAHQVHEEGLCYRTRMLIRDSVEALKSYWGGNKIQDWLASCPENERIQAICMEEFDKIGFPSLRKRIMEKTLPETIRRCLEEAAQGVTKTTQVYIAGGGALILLGAIERFTEDIDLINEVPRDIRENYPVLERIQTIFGMHFGHVQSHYFPSGWIDRVHSYEVFGKLQVFLVDIYDIFLSKLFSSRNKDMGDLVVLEKQLNKETLVDRFKTSCRPFLAAPRLLEIAQHNWKVLFGETLPS